MRWQPLLPPKMTTAPCGCLSTFLDMQRERGNLVRQTFPASVRCACAGGTADVDLRWASPRQAESGACCRLPL